MVLSPGISVLLSSSLATTDLASTGIHSGGVGILASDRFPVVVERLAEQLEAPVVQTASSQRHRRRSTQPIQSNNGNDGTISHILSVEPWDTDDGSSTDENAYAIGLSQMDTVATAKPFLVDFCPSRTGSRLGQRATQAKDDLLLQAIGSSSQQTIVDATAGWGADAWIMAHAPKKQHTVRMVERNPIVATLVQDALRRIPDSDPLKERFSLTVGDISSDAWITTSRHAPADVVYLDPMFPPRKKKALVKKNMQVLHGLLSSQDKDESVDDHVALFAAAIDNATSRVVVKRPVHAAWLVADAKPSFAVTGPTSRWDVYLM